MNNGIIKYIFFIFALLANVQCEAQNKEVKCLKTRTMERKIIFEKRLKEHISIKQILIVEEGKKYAKTYVINDKQKKEVEIDSFEFSNEMKFLNSIAKLNPTIPLPALPSEYSRIVDVYLKDKNLFIIQNYAADVYFTHILFKDEYNFEKSQCLIGNVPFNPSFAIPSYRSEMKEMNNDLYIHIYGQGTDISEFLCRYDSKYNHLVQYVFPQKTKSIIIPDEKRIFREMDFEKPDSYMKISKAIENVLVESGKMKPNPKFTFKYLWCFDFDNFDRYDDKDEGVRQTGITYFFYQEDYPYSKVKVIRYNNGKFAWLLDDYKEKLISKNDWCNIE